LATLEELVHIELELSWKAGSGPFLEAFLARFHVLNEHETALRLLQQEYQVRWR
jgi:hypothetical protein